MSTPPKEAGNLIYLPDEMHYLIEPALKYGRYQFPEEIAAFLQTVDESELETLRAIGQRVRKYRHYSTVNQFLDYFDRWPEEISRLYSLFRVLDQAGIEFR